MQKLVVIYEVLLHWYSNFVAMKMCSQKTITKCIKRS